MLEPLSLRRLLMVDPCEACQRLLPRLQGGGWDVRSCSLDAAAQHACDVGLLRLQPAHLREPGLVQRLIERSQSQWIAVVSAEQLRMQQVGDFVAEWFFDFHTLPFDVLRVQVTLGRAHDLRLAQLKGTERPLGTLEAYKYRAEHQALCDVLERHRDNLSVAARVLGISRPTFYRLLHKHQMK